MIADARIWVIAFGCILAACSKSSAPDVKEGSQPAQTAANPAGESVEIMPPPVLDSQHFVEEEFILSTNEPFWNAHVERGSLVLKGLEGERRLAVDSNNVLFDGRSVMAHDAKGTIEIRITERLCQDNMSGASFPYTGKIAFDGGQEIMGCARPASDPPPGEPQ
ncbi:hypothetical protein [Dokdonella sp.]|uniref:hypothetical protein n=1 Tax=Dokdonella sp. TaxID=2291710 RepID=UPI0035297FBF